MRGNFQKIYFTIFIKINDFRINKCREISLHLLLTIYLSKAFVDAFIWSRLIAPKFLVTILPFLSMKYEVGIYIFIFFGKASYVHGS